MNPDKVFDFRSLFDLSGRIALVVGGGSITRTTSSIASSTST
jgi:uridylate kinase